MNQEILVATLKKSLWGSLLYVLLVSAGAVPASAQKPAPAEEGTTRTGWYVVRPGDSIIEITRRYLGTPDRWQENWKLNPEIEDPHRIRPGQRLRILLRGDLPQRSARVATLSRDVDEILAPLDWAKASLDDLLLERDGVRTQSASSAELELSGGNRMLITENSLVYLKDSSPASAPVSRQAIEIVQGQADLEGVPAGPIPSDVEILVGGSVAKPRTGAGGEIQARARRPETGGAQFMVYQGESDVEAGGKTVEVPQGMGTSVPQGEPPGPPEELLPSPPALSPEAGARRAGGRATLVWEEVPGAVDYTVEVCGDPDCGLLLRRVVEHPETQWLATDLPPGKHFWRATARSPSGLDGYPGESRPLEIFEGAIDSQPPTVALKPQGKSVTRDGVLHVGADAGLELAIEDSASGVARKKVLLDGESVPPEILSKGLLSGPWDPGSHELTFDVEDGAGNPSAVKTATFVYDPDPPTVSWEPVAAGWRGDRGMTLKAWPSGGSPQGASSSRKAKRSRKATASPLQWSGAGWGWQNLDRTWQVDGEIETLLLRATVPLTLQGPGVRLAPGEVLRLRFEDATGVGGLRFGAIPGGGDGPALLLEVRDVLDNVRTERWQLLRE